MHDALPVHLFERVVLLDVEGHRALKVSGSVFIRISLGSPPRRKNPGDNSAGVPAAPPPAGFERISLRPSRVEVENCRALVAGGDEQRHGTGSRTLGPRLELP